MKRSILWLAVFSSVTGGCGWYTNIPAQIHVKSIEPAVVTITYKLLADTTETQFIQPKVTMVAEPGSIGVTFKRIRIAYWGPAPKLDRVLVDNRLASINNGVDIAMGAFLRVEPSQYREDYAKKLHEMKDYAGAKLAIGDGQTEVPIISDDILELGSPTATNRLNRLYAEVYMEGVDDAQFPYGKSFSIPIVFVDSVQKK